MTTGPVAFPPPFGVPRGPSLTTAGLLSAYLDGATAGSSSEAHIEGALLMGSDHHLAIRVAGVVIVRVDVPPVAAPVHAALCEALDALGMRVVEEESVLAGAVASEMAAPRGFEWELWARDPEEARLELMHRAAGDLPSIWESPAAPQSADADVHAVIEWIEREL